MGPQGDVAIRRTGEGKLDIKAAKLTVNGAIEVPQLIIDGLPLNEYVKKLVQQIREKTGPSGLIVVMLLFFLPMSL